MEDKLASPPGTIKDLQELREAISNSEQPKQFLKLFHVEGDFFSDSPNSHTLKSISQEKFKDMLPIRWSDLDLRLFSPYAYAHCNLCQHFVLIKSIRLAHPQLDKDLLASEEGILETIKAKERRRVCRICDYYFADWIVKGDRLVPDSPCFLCSQCYEHLHYSQEGNLLYTDFELLPYLGVA